MRGKTNFDIENWCYNNNAITPSAYPHEQPDLSIFDNKDIWKNKNIFLIRYTTCFDTKEKTSFYGCLKDDAFEIGQLKAKRRYEIKKGLKNFFFRRLSMEDIESMYQVYIEAMKGYNNYTLCQNKTDFCKHWQKVYMEKNAVLYGVFSKNSRILCGFAHVCENGKYIPISTFKTMVAEERKGVNFALMYGICMQYNELLRSGQGYYLWDGYKNILHETSFQDWLIKYFGFRKAYCKLNIVYRPSLRPLIKLLFPFRKMFMNSKKGIFKKIYGVLLMEELRR